MAKYLKALAGAALLLACGIASAQLGNGGGTYAGVDKANPNAPDILGTYVEHAKTTLNAGQVLLNAVGLAEEAGKAGAEAQGLSADATRSKIESSLKVQADGGQALMQKLAAKPALSDAARQQFTNGVAELSRGYLAEAALSRDLVDIRKTLKGSNAASISVLYLSKALPGAVKELGQTLQAAAAYAKANNITLPQAATEALSQL
nr:hypothetical protein [uncultured Duganella sp.]